MYRTLWGQALFCGALVVAACGYGRAEEPRWVMRQSKDLDGDGRREAISLRIEGPERGIFVLQVGGSQVRERLWEGIRGFAAVDLKRGDRYKEIRVHTDGPSDDYGEFFFAYYGKRLHRAGGVTGWAWIRGDGRVTAHEWHDFWTLKRRYRYGRDHRLHEVAQRFYDLNAAGHVVKPFTMYRDPRLRRPLMKVPLGTHMRLLRYDSIDKTYYGHTDRRVYGWLRERYDLMSLPYAD